MARYLLDTNIILFMATAPEKLSKPVLELIRTPENEFFISSASSWEMSIKAALGKLMLTTEVSHFVPAMIRRLGLIELKIDIAHTLAVADLKKIHQDPFDHLLIAQSVYESLPLITADKTLARYPIQCILNT
jgi:PIN domain nuclease of toxin-antitoxin system